MRFPNEFQDNLILKELAYNKVTLANKHRILFFNMIDEQKLVYHEIMVVLSSNEYGIFFIYGYSGTWKTYLWKALSIALRFKGQIVLNVYIKWNCLFPVT